MHSSHRAVYFFCYDPTKDPVASRVFDALLNTRKLTEARIVVDGYPVLEQVDPTDNSFTFVRTRDVLSHHYDHYLPILHEHFADYDFAGLVNWHEGEKAPDAILTTHTNGDVISGLFGRAHPLYMRNLILALEENRKSAELDQFTVTTEATHWSGLLYGGSLDLIGRYPVPLIDIEIGSSHQSWSNAEAAQVVAHSLLQVFTRSDRGVRSLLCVGGVHFEPSFAAAALQAEPDRSIAVSHILSNHCVVTGSYNTESGLRKLQACVHSIEGGIHGITFHDNLPGPFKAQIRRLGERLSVPVFKHQALRSIQDLPLW